MKKNEQKTELKIVRNLLNQFNKNINYCHWKSNEHFKDALLGIDDLDILIDRNQYGDVIKILSDLNFKHFYVPQARTYTGIEDYLGFDEETGKIIHLHLHSRLVVGEKHLKGFLLPIEKYILKNKYYNQEYNAYHSSLFDEMLLLILRCSMKVRKRDIIKKSVIDKKTYKEFKWLKSKNIDFQQQIEKNELLNEKAKKQIIRIFNEEPSFNSLNRLKHILYHDYSCYTQGSGLTNTFKRTHREIKRIFLEIEKRYLKFNKIFTRRKLATGGVIIAFVGSDGAGKSTTIKEIYDWLFQVMDVRYFYLGSGDGNSSLLRKPFKLMMKIAQKLNIVKKSNNFSNSKLQPVKKNNLSLAFKIWTFLLSIERNKKIKQLSICRNYGYIVLTDRYPQSEFFGLCDGKKINDNSLAAKKENEMFRIAKLCPPDLAIKMIVDPDVAVNRKPGEIDIETSKNLTERIKKIKFSPYTKSILINSNLSKEEVLLNVKKAIWKNI